MYVDAGLYQLAKGVPTIGYRRRLLKVMFHTETFCFGVISIRVFSIGNQDFVVGYSRIPQILCLRGTLVSEPEQGR
jgi:hypothetical protein